MASAQENPHPKPLSMSFSDDARRWRAVQDRDAAADGLFVYAVKTTKIYCRPTCKARLARRANVRFYDCGRAAQAAGFRACKRCRPELAGAMPEELAVRKIRAFVEERRSSGGAQSLSQMARQTGLSKWHFHRVFKRCAGVTPSEFLRAAGEEAARSTSTTLSPPTSGTLSPWTDSDLGDGALDWLRLGQGADDGRHDRDFALFDVESALAPPLNEHGFPWDDANFSLDDFLVWPEETFPNRVK
ncbi:DNA repair and transcription factor Ada [Cordyceps fumosorosea ARSEF 2679]|uniref:DNA repair and transcription factor Ada n=1 Tax=Cordyceps fumosorosea (strain ARSEF 2679) TaxID=1081104 RepID=A0A162J131_CORFA|nr:DNA repair and transcription factor Ada [Cordyceps fumosorosea ARSEF 2679]OAA62242.1 DNA repair and transcription factor Ada [Cordyceps fumosorosea ARSEF 2679]